MDTPAPPASSQPRTAREYGLFHGYGEQGSTEPGQLQDHIPDGQSGVREAALTRRLPMTWGRRILRTSQSECPSTMVFDSMTQPTLVVTGDIVLDCHLYGGLKTAATSFSEPGTVIRQELGGAVLTHNLIRAAAAVDGGYVSHLDLDTTGLEASLPPHLRSYGVWTGHPIRKGATKDQVWRADGHFGYGSTEPAKQGGVFSLNAGRPEGEVVLTVIDDGGILFRQEASKDAWPVLDGTSGFWYLLKMSWPLCRGDLWAALGPIMDRLIVIVSAADLRREDVQINARLSWEQCAEDTIHALQSDPIASDLLRAAHVIVNYESEGALWFERGGDRGNSSYRLLFDHELLEGDHAGQFEGKTYGSQTCVAVGVAHQLMARHARPGVAPSSGPFVNAVAMRKAIEEGIIAGLAARRLLLELGHGPIEKPDPGVPVEPLGRCAAKSHLGLVMVEVPEMARLRAPGCQWTILQSEETTSQPEPSAAPLTGLAQLTALHGQSALSHVPALRMGGLFTVDRSEIESLRTLEALIRGYDQTKVQAKPLSIAVFGPPGAGKSFGVKALAKAVLGDKSPFLEFNLSQFKSPDELIGAFHRVRDAVLGGTTPVAFWDEFDSQQYKWLQFLLAPMQDGAFQEGQVTHPIGKCVFIFAGGTSAALEQFGAAEPSPLGDEAIAKLEADDRAEHRRRYLEQSERYREFVLLKGPDFVSRLHGFLNVLGPNPRTGTACPDITWPIRRAIILRGILRLKDGDPLEIDAGLLNALLAVPIYRHGARSFEKIVSTLAQGRDAGRLNRSALPPQPLLGRETDADAFHKLLTATDAFKKHPDLEALAAAVHNKFLKEADKSNKPAPMAAKPAAPWTIDPAIMRSYDALSPDAKASNRAAARRIPDHLALLGYVVEPQREGETEDWQTPLAAAIEKHVDRLAQAEHLGWCAERRANGWVFASERNNTLKHHPLLADWADLSPADRDKDRSSARAIPDLLTVAGFKAVPVNSLPVV